MTDSSGTGAQAQSEATRPARLPAEIIGNDALVQLAFEGYSVVDTRLASSAESVLREVRERCLFADDDGGIGVTEDVVIDAALFERICEVLKNTEGREPDPEETETDAPPAASLRSVLGLARELASESKTEGGDR